MPIEGSPGTSTGPHDLVGEVVGGRYRLTSLIGRGGMASVYRAEDRELPREVAIKLMPPGSTDSHELLRQRNEIETLASLNHHALVTLLDTGVQPSENGDRAFLVMELVDGPNLRRALRRPIAPDQVAHIGADIAEALHYMHGKGVIHRDVKPANILLAPSAFPGRRFQAKLADFGIARLLDANRLTSTGVIIGTMNYLSPEQARGRAVGPATDVYSLGLVLLEALTGEKVFPGSAVESVSARLNSAPEIPSAVDPAWRELLSQMTALDPALRPPPMELALAMRALGASSASAGGSWVPASAGSVPRFPPPPPEVTTQETRAWRQRTVRTQMLPAAPLRADRSGNRISRRGRRRLITIVSAAVLAAGVAGGSIAWSNASQPASVSPSYPAVSGTLGTHLKDLERNVVP